MDSLERRVRRAVKLRKHAANYYKSLPLPEQANNGDDRRYAAMGHFASYTKGLPHDEALGEVDGDAYRALLRALHSGEPRDFDAIPLGWPDPDHRQPLTNPQAGLAFDMEGIDSHLLTIPPCYQFDSKGVIGEIAENYWLALLRDVPFVQYGTGAGADAEPGGASLTATAAADLSRYAVFDGPKDHGNVTPATLFRGVTKGDLAGPYISQFLLLDVPYGAERFEQKVAYALPEQDYMVDPAEWLKVQKGFKPPVPPAYVDHPKYLYRGRDLAQYVHIDELFQAYLNACLILITPNERGGLGAPLNPGNPYPMTNQTGFGTLGEPNFKGLVAEVATRALKAVWYQKWFVHRRLRPEVYAGRIHHKLSGTPGADKYPFHHAEFPKLKDTVLPLIKSHNTAYFTGGDSWLLPMAFPEGSPTHPAYGAGHATVAGACVTVLKALFNGDQPIRPLLAAAKRKDGTSWGVVQPSHDGTALEPYGGTDDMTVGGELDKLASNVGIARNFAGVHWRSDYTASVTLGEEVALHFLKETMLTYNENVYCTLKRFDGTRVTISNSGAL